MGLRREHPPPFIYFTLGGIVCFDYSDVAHELTIQNRVQEKSKVLSALFYLVARHTARIFPQKIIYFQN